MKPETVVNWHKKGFKLYWDFISNHVIVLSEKHLLKLLAEYVRYYNKDRTYYNLDKDPPLGRPVLKRESDDDKVISIPRVNGLHHKYIWKKSA